MQSITSLQLRLRLFLLLLLLFFVLLPMVSSFISANEIAQIHLFLREEEIPAGKVVLSASRAFKLAREYAKRGVSSVIIEGPMESPHELHQQDAPFNTSFEYPIFNMNRLTGLLKTAKRLDFDDAELHDAGCILSETVLPIQLTNQRSPSYVANTPYCCFPIQIFNSCQDILNVDICVEDINDNAPKWDLESPQKNDLELILRIPENMPVGNSLELPSAVDLDSGPNKLLTYEMRPKLPEFEVVWNDTSSRLHLYLKVELDREEKSYYSFTITAFDGGIKPRSGSLDVIIQILDVNDNSPVFEKNIYFVSIPENTKALMPIVQVVAVDIDHGENAEVAYTISPLTDPEFAQLFVVDLSTGWITLKGKLDFEDYKEISLTIVASDKGDPPRRSTCQVQMVVTDINDNAPQLLFEPISLTGFALVPENENPGRVVSVFTVIDEDSGVNGETVCWVASIFRNEDDLLRDKLGPDSLFKLDLIILPFTKVYQLSTAAVFDRESGNEYRVGITCSDKGYPSQNSTDHVIVRILDVNDHAPVFPFKHFTYRAIESYPLNTTLFTLTAIDLDEGENATITYSLLSPQDNIFTINNETGEVSLSQPLDYEKQTQHNFTIVAVDGGSPALTGSITVTLFVDDVNDNAPILTSDRFISILENHSAADPIGALRATDYDLGPNGNIYFKLTSIRPCFCGIPGTEEKTPDITESLCSWAVELVNKCDVQTVKKAYRLCSRIPMNHAPSWASKEYRRFLMTEKGDVFLRYPNLDRETTPVYMIQGVVADRGHPPKRTTFCITIAVDDINDCHPKFTFPASFNNTVLVRIPISRGQPLIQLHATDYDANENGELRFAFAEDSDSSLTSLFAIHPFSGLVVSKYSLQPKDLEFLGQVPLLLKQTHTLRIRVSDLGTPSLASYAILRLNFQVRSNHALEAVLPSLREQQILQQQHPIDLFDEYGGVAPEVETPAQGTRKNDLSFFVLCAFFVFLLLLFLAVLLFIVLNRRPECLASVLCPTTITTTTETRTHRLPLAPFVSPLCHENRNCQSGRTLTQSARITPCHNLQQTLPLASVFSESGASSPESSAV